MFYNLEIQNVPLSMTHIYEALVNDLIDQNKKIINK